MMTTTNVLMLITKESESDFQALELPLEANDIQSVGCGAECLCLVTKDGRIHSNRIQDCRITKWKQPPGLTQYTVSQVESGLSHYVALTASHKVISWGKNDRDQLGRKTTSAKQKNRRKRTTSFFNASLVTSIQNIKVLKVSCGDGHTLCLSEEGHVYSWGANDRGQLGRESVSNDVPQIVKDLENILIVQISAGGRHSIALSVSRKVFCWGSNGYGQLGLGSENTSQPLPLPCPDLCDRNIDSICCGENHTAVLTQDGCVITCGLGSSGQLGHDSRENEFRPRQIEHLMNVSQIACGRNHTLAWIKSMNKLHIFGFEKSETIDVPNQHLTSILVCGGMCSFVYQSSSDKVEIAKEDAITRHESHLLTLDLVQDVMGQNRDNKMNCILERALSHASCINESFLTYENGHHVCSESDHGIDLERAEIFFKKLRTPHHFDIARKALKKLLTNLTHRLTSGIEMLRLYILLPCCLYVDNKVYDDDVVSSLANHLLHLSDAEKIQIGKWLKCISTKFFKRYVWFFKMCVMKALNRLHNVYNISVMSKEITSVKSCVEVLEMLSEVNLCRGQPVSVAKFYLNDLIDKINIQGDFLSFMQDRLDDKFHFCKYPFLYNSASKFLLLKCQCEQIMESRLQMLGVLGLQKMDVRRAHIIEDTRSFLAQNGLILNFKLKLNVTFKDEITYAGDGIRQDFFVELFEKLLNPKFGVFYEEEDSNSQWFIQGSNLDDVHFIGLMCGLAMSNSCTLNLQFPPALYKKLLKKPVTFKDLWYLKPVNYRSLKQMMDYKDDDMEDVFCINFAVAHQSKIVELCPNGEDIPVTQDNKEEFVDKVKEYYLNTSIEKEFQRFSEGFYTGIPEKLLSSFQPQELEDVLVGNERYDFEAFEQVTEYEENYTRNHQTIKFFWEIFHKMEVDDHKAFLRFLTGTHRIPVYGIKRLKMTIFPRDVEGTAPDSLLPHALTCTYYLRLPRYTSKDSLERNVLFAIRNFIGFGHF